jgi:hypothetical protein
MAESLFVDNPQAWNPAAPVLDAVMGMISDSAEAADDLNKANIALAKELDAREQALGSYVTQLQLERQRLAKVREELDSYTVAKGVIAYDITVGEILDRIRVALGNPSDDHVEGHAYLSTGCLHGAHDYCKSMTGIQGTKRGGKCKFCDTQCICTCHTEDEESVIEPYCEGFPDTCPNKVTVEPAEHHGGGVRCGCFDEDGTTERVCELEGQGVRCNWAMTQWPHVPHEWEPQPGMPKVHCPGTIKEWK